MRNLALSVAGFHVLCVLFGAPLLSDVLATFAMAVLLSLCTTLPLSLAVPPFSLHALLHAECESRAQKRALCGAVCALLGAWLGAFVIPLDWDLWWQRWPLPNAVACIGGFLFGFICLGSVLRIHSRQKLL